MNNIQTIDHDPETGEIRDSETTTANLPALLGGNRDQSLAVSIAMAEVDQQIATAHAFPRSIDRAVKAIMTLATLDEETAKECIYALPRGGKPIVGPSVRLAEIIASQWGNNRVGTRITHVDRIEKYVEAEGIFHDLENNSAITSRVRRRLTTKSGALLTEDMIIVTGNAASAIAKRNAILGGVPKAVWRGAYAQVHRVIAGDTKTLVARRSDAVKAFAAFGVKPEQIFVALDVAGMDDLGIEELIVLSGMNAALKNQESTVEEMFPPKKVEGAVVDKTDVAGRMAALAGNGNGKPKETPAEPDKKKAPAKAKAKETSAKEPAEQKQASLDVALPVSNASSDGGADVQDSPPADGAADQSDAAGAASGEASADDQPSETSRSADATPKQEAYAMGRQARADKLTKKACPTEIRTDDDLLEAWMEGFDESPDGDE